MTSGGVGWRRGGARVSMPPLRSSGAVTLDAEPVASWPALRRPRGARRRPCLAHSTRADRGAWQRAERAQVGSFCLNTSGGLAGGGVREQARRDHAAGFTGLTCWSGERWRNAGAPGRDRRGSAWCAGIQREALEVGEHAAHPRLWAAARQWAPTRGVPTPRGLCAPARAALRPCAPC
jgi:hypothetical protein